MTVSIIHAVVDPLQLHARNPQRYPFLLESSGENAVLGRYDILFCCPGDALVSSNGSLTGPFSDSNGFLSALDAWYEEESSDSEENHGLPFTGGWFLYLGYELLAEIEPTVPVYQDPLMPVALAVRCPVALVTDRRNHTQYLVAEKNAGNLVDTVESDMALLKSGRASPTGEFLASPVIEEPGGNFLQAVDVAKQYIHDGDIFQANLSRSWTAKLKPGITDPALYAALRNANPAPFAGLCKWKDGAIISSSPERLVEARNGRIQTRPIAGTRKRSRNDVEDDRLSEELIAHPKERAEHVMLLDLERNDIGRIAKTGSVSVDEFMVVESYEYVHHIVSNVSGTLRDDINPGDIIKAVFPGGTITGCPKVRCMEIINELEQQARGAYTGSMGYLGMDGSMDMNILIRTMVRKGNEIVFRAGAGIVADSQPEFELEETRAKARGLLVALE